MFPSAICRLSVPLAASILRASVGVAQPITVGAVDKVQAQVEATQAGQTRALGVKSEIYFRDRCHSREGARLQAALKDGTQLTLGENATLVVDEFIYDPSMSRGALSVSVIRGAFLYVGGRIEGVNGAKVQIRTPIGAIGVRGTTVRGGPIDNGYGVIVLSGEVTVTGRKGTVTLKQGQGTMLFGGGKPQRAAAWPAGRMKRAVASITLRKSARSTVGDASGLVRSSLLRAARRRAGQAGRDESGRAKRQARIAVMTDKIEGSPSQHKPFRVRRDAGGSDILASFDTLEDAVRNVRRRRGDWRYVIHDGRKIVWPESRAKVE